MSTEFDLVVIGGGSGGIGAALSAARLGLRVLLAEQADSLGGTAVRGGVNCWERGAGGTGLPFDIYKRLKRLPNAVGIYAMRRHICFPEPGTIPFPGGEQLLDPALRYIDSLRCFGAGSFANQTFIQAQWHGVPFEPEAYSRVVTEMLHETGRASIWTNAKFVSATTLDRKVRTVTFADGRTATAENFVDASADIVVAAQLGCATRAGQESREVYQEPHAPHADTDMINATTLIYRVMPKPTAEIDALPPDIPATCWWAEKFPGAAVNEYPGGGRNINMLPTMEGRETQRLGAPAAYAECRRRVIAHWHHFQTIFPEFQHYAMSWIAPALGVRETRRLVGRYVLTEHDLDTGLRGQTHDDIICISDHTKDTHGEARQHMQTELNWPYGVPYRCLLPREFDNLAVACRGASFSSIGASSCRLSRTMMQLGQAAGTAAFLAHRGTVTMSKVSPAELREALRKQHVQLDYPAPKDLQAFLEHEDA